MLKLEKMCKTGSKPEALVEIFYKIKREKNITEFLLKEFVALTQPAEKIPDIVSINHKVAAREAGPQKGLSEID